VRIGRSRAAFPSQDYLAARIELDPSFAEEAAAAFDERRARTFAELERRVAQEPGVVAVTFADRAPGSGRRSRVAGVESVPGAGPAFDYGFMASTIGPGFFETFDRPIVAGRAFNGGDFTPVARTVIVNEAFVRGFRLRGGLGSPVGARLRYSGESERQADTFEIVGIVRDLGLDPDDEGEELPFVFHAAAPAIAPLVMSVHVRGDPAPLLARLPVLAAGVDPRLSVHDARPLEEWRGGQGMVFTAALASVTALVLFLSALGIFSLLSVSVSRRTREIGLRTALGADPRHVARDVLWRALVLMGSGVALGGGLLLFFLALREEDVARFAVWVGVTAAVMLGTGLVASIAPVRRALRINPTDALREV
jgi:hypothetical protein